MMKPLLSPMILLVEIFMLLILAMILERSPDIKIVLPNKLLTDTIVVASKDGNVSAYYDTHTQLWNPISSYTQYGDNFLLGNIACESEKCKQIPEPKEGTKIIYLRGKLEDELSSLIADSCLTFPKKCTNVTYHINDDGTIDYKRLKDEFPIFEKILKTS